MEEHGKKYFGVHGSQLRDIILGGQDGLVNVLGIILAVASATNDARIVIIAGLAATFAESISMAAVAYTSSKAERSYYRSELEREEYEIEHMPKEEVKEVRVIYYKKGFRGRLLNSIVKKITSSKKLWLDIMMKEELNLSENKSTSPGRDAFVVGFSAVLGSIIPLFAFFFLSIQHAIIASLIISTTALFITGAVKAKVTVGNWVKSGSEMAIIGMAAAIIGYAIGTALGVMV
ncbi:MAG: VIT1/CCC1 transporter family protein [Candidatus Aenigmarchaeota archaeon]|nr:VIT1/CCC1 transporter family protein [Candidatus Aenigmarchaeota archaeon]MDI6722933.1 VIT1/CCC1 transporter family protein [Candidatus Aenigmarchaeota archaeon]